MKQLLINIISIYQNFLSVLLKNLLGVNGMCRFDETCSAYSKRMIKEGGIFKGIYLSTIRILKCQPLYKGSLNGNI